MIPPLRVGYISASDVKGYISSLVLTEKPTVILHANEFLLSTHQYRKKSSEELRFMVVQFKSIISSLHDEHNFPGIFLAYSGITYISR
jgi:hypothetical protein